MIKTPQLFHEEIIQCHQQGDNAQALKISQVALSHYPNNIVLLTNAAAFSQLLNNTSLARHYYSEVLKIHPNHSIAHSNLAALCVQDKQINQAKKHYLSALEFDPDNAQLHKNFAVFLSTEQQFDNAVEHYQIALKINPKDVTGHCHLAMLFIRLKRLEEAVKCYQIALKLSPDNANINYYSGVLYLLLKQFSAGWQGYEYRYHKDNDARTTFLPDINTPQYQGESLRDKHLLIFPEQGIGDEVMFASTLCHLNKPETKTTLLCNPRLVNLFQYSFPFLTVIAKKQGGDEQNIIPDADYYLMIGSLPKFYCADVKRFHKRNPYLKVDDNLYVTWQDRFRMFPHKLNIGISWVGGANKTAAKDRSVDLKKWLPILELASKRANIISLQYGNYTKDINELKKKNIIIHDWDDADPLKDLDSFAAQIKALDLVISIDNSTVHFAGALGTKTFVMLPYYQDWRWAESDKDSYWYSEEFRLFHQDFEGSWDHVLVDIAEATKDFILQ